MTVLAEAGAIQVVAWIDREVIRDGYKIMPRQEVAFVRDNLTWLGRVIARKHEADEHTAHSEKNTRLVVIKSNDLAQS